LVGQSGGFNQRPQQDMGVEEQAHSRTLKVIKHTVRQWRVKIPWDGRPSC
jgi:hypothetical protein